MNRYSPHFYCCFSFTDFTEHQKKKLICVDSAQTVFSQFAEAYSANNPKQKAITNATVTDLVVGCNMPL